MGMAWNVDARVPVVLGSLHDASPEDALLIEGPGGPNHAGAVHFDLGSSEHGAGCTCCVPRSPVALALNALFQARAKGEVPFFRRVMALTRSSEGDMAVWAAVCSDPLTAGRFRLAD
jgi:hypothetical protein